MPSLFKIGGYTVYFWSNENNGPVHVHVGRGKPTPNATKLWLTAAGGCVLAHNNGRIPKNELDELLDIIAAQYFMICDAWKKHFCVDVIDFYC